MPTINQRKSPPRVIFDVGHYFYKKKIPLLPSFCTFLNRLLFSAYIPSSASIGKDTVFGYWGLGVVIHNNSCIGKNCVIGQNVTIGRNFGDSNVPIVGNDVYIGAGSVIFGNIRIGDNVIIGANSVVNKDIPPNTTVAGNPFRILKANRAEKYYELDDIKAY